MKHYIISITLMLLLIQPGLVAQEVQNQSDAQGKKTGFWVHRSEDGAVKTEEGSYVAGLRVGIWTAYYPDGKIKHQITFKDGIAKGKASFFYPDGTLWEEGTWNEYCWIGDYRLYYKNGQAAYEWTYNDQGRRQGTQKYFFENGSPKYIGDWTNGQITSNVNVYDSTGVLVSTRVYNDGVFETTKKPESILPQNQNVQPEKSASPFHGTGDHTVYRLNGKIDKKGYFRDGILYNGEVYIYDNNEVLRQIRVFENGKLLKVNPVLQETNPL